MKDNMGSRVRERVWVDKFDKTVDPPVLVETVAMENGIVTEVIRHGEKAEAETETGSRDTTDVPGHHGEKVTLPKLNSYEAVSVVALAAEDAGIGLEQALKFLSAMRLNMASRGSKGPKGKQ